MHAEALVLDFGGVISRTLFETHDLSEHALGLQPGTLTWRGPFAPESDPEWQAMVSGKITEREYWAIRMRETGQLVGEDWTEFAQFVGRVRGAEPAAVIRPEALQSIARAKQAGRKLAILSNELDLFYGAEFREKLPFLAAFDVIVDATHTGILKPDPRSYELVSDALGLPPGACVFVDDQHRNILGARDFGMQTVHFDVARPASGYSMALSMLGVSS